MFCRYHGGVRARWAIACHEELYLLQEGVAEITWPFLLLHGIKDRLCSPEASKQFYKKAKSDDKKIKVGLAVCLTQRFPLPCENFCCAAESATFFNKFVFICGYYINKFVFKISEDILLPMESKRKEKVNRRLFAPLKKTIVEALFKLTLRR